MDLGIRLKRDSKYLDALLRKAENIEMPKNSKSKLFTRPVVSLKVSTGIAILVNDVAYIIHKDQCNFIEFLIAYIFYRIPEKWFNDENKIEQNKVHPMAHWRNKFFKEDICGTYLLRMAYDIYTIDNHCSAKVKIKRLLNVEQFWGYRYELLIACVFIEAGYNIEWIKTSGEPIVEFNARHIVTKKEWAVECKSRQGLNSLNLETSMKRLQNKARKKNSDQPMIIFNEANLPIDEFKEINHGLDKYYVDEKFLENGSDFHILITNLLDTRNEGGWPRMAYNHWARHGIKDSIFQIIYRLLQYPLDNKLMYANL